MVKGQQEEVLRIVNMALRRQVKQLRASDLAWREEILKLSKGLMNFPAPPDVQPGQVDHWWRSRLAKHSNNQKTKDHRWQTQLAKHAGCNLPLCLVRK